MIKEGVLEEKIIEDFININNIESGTNGKYASKFSTFFEDIKDWQNQRIIKNYNIKPLQCTFEITNKCNCNCKHCGMDANKIKDKTSMTEKELRSLIDDLDLIGIPAYAITGGEPFLEFDKMCMMIQYAKNRLDLAKIISNGFWGRNVDYYFKKLEESGLLSNKFFIPAIQISIGEQNVSFEYICNIINYVTTHYSQQDLNIGIVYTKTLNEKDSKLVNLYEKYLEKYGSFPKNRVYMTLSYYVHAGSNFDKDLDVQSDPVYNLLPDCDNRFNQEIGKFVSPKIFMKCDGNCYSCEVFNIHNSMCLGNYFKDGLYNVLEKYNSNKYIKFIRDYGIDGFKKIIPDRILKETSKETACQSCQFCIELCEKHNLLR